MRREKSQEVSLYEAKYRGGKSKCKNEMTCVFFFGGGGGREGPQKEIALKGKKVQKIDFVSCGRCLDTLLFNITETLTSAAGISL